MKEIVIDTIRIFLESEISNKIICYDQQNEIYVFFKNGSCAKIKTKIIS